MRNEVLAPYVDDNFVMTLTDFPFLITFIRDEDGNPEYFRSRYFVGVLADGTPGVTAQPSSQKADATTRRARPFAESICAGKQYQKNVPVLDAGKL